MKKRLIRTATLSLTLLFAAGTVSFSQETSPSTKEAAVTLDNAAVAQPALDAKIAATASEAKTTAAQPSEAEMMKQMMELAKLGDNHKLLTSLAGSWTYTLKSWMDPAGAPTESKGTATRKPVMDGRYCVADFAGKFKMSGPDGKMKEMDFKGMSIEGYDNVKQKFFSVWCDNMGTGVMTSEGTYDPATKTFNYTGEYEAMPGVKSKMRETLKIVDKDHHSFVFYEDRGQGEMRAMEISYTRKK